MYGQENYETSIFMKHKCPLNDINMNLNYSIS